MRGLVKPLWWRPSSSQRFLAQMRSRPGMILTRNFIDFSPPSRPSDAFVSFWENSEGQYGPQGHQRAPDAGRRGSALGSKGSSAGPSHFRHLTGHVSPNKHVWAPFSPGSSQTTSAVAPNLPHFPAPRLSLRPQLTSAAQNWKRSPISDHSLINISAKRQ